MNQKSGREYLLWWEMGELNSLTAAQGGGFDCKESLAEEWSGVAKSEWANQKGKVDGQGG